MLWRKLRRGEKKACDLVPMGEVEEDRCLVGAFFKILMVDIVDFGVVIGKDLLAAGIHLEVAGIADKGAIIGERAGAAVANAPKSAIKIH